MSPPDVRTLLAELDTAGAMVTLVRYSGPAEVVGKYREFALRSYHSAMSLIAKRALASHHEKEVRGRLEPIRHWLEAEGLLR